MILAAVWNMNEHRLLILINTSYLIDYLLSCLDCFHFARYIIHYLQRIVKFYSGTLHNSIYQTFTRIFSLLVDFLRSWSVSIASIQQNIIKIKFIINASNIRWSLWASLFCLRVNSFAYVFVAYVSTHLLFCIYSLISNRRKKAK